MRTWISVIAMLSATTALHAHPAAAFPADSTTAIYELQGASTYEDGCFGPCACPIRERPMRGMFRLKRGQADPLFQNYDVTDVQWLVALDGQEIAITGAGRYKVGGEVAVMQEMSLDLAVGSRPPEHFDSGVVQGGGQFPQIDVTISIHGMVQCTDTVLHVVAVPAVAGVEDGPNNFGLRKAIPNPFRGSTSLELRLREAGPVDVVIYDAQGRAVRALAHGIWLDAGPHVMQWDGRDDSGADRPDGFYYARMRADGREYGRALVMRR